MRQLFLTLKNSDRDRQIDTHTTAHARVHSQSISLGLLFLEEMTSSVSQRSFSDKDDQMNVPKCTSHSRNHCTLRLEIHNKREKSTGKKFITTITRRTSKCKRTEKKNAKKKYKI